MVITLTNEKRFALLASIVDVAGSATKQVILDNIEHQGYVVFSPKELAMKTNRKELRWRNDYAFIPKGLVNDGYIDDSVRDRWLITDQGKFFLEALCEMLIDSQMQTFKKLTSVAVQRAVEILSSDEGEFEYYRQDLQQDGIFLPNETQELIVRRIRRYKKIVEELKDKYQGRCQIENCGFTFTKRDGKHYAEAHHLVPLSEGGSQNPSNVLILCANHHRMFHYAVISIGELANGKRPIIINGTETNIVYE